MVVFLATKFEYSSYSLGTGSFEKEKRRKKFFMFFAVSTLQLPKDMGSQNYALFEVEHSIQK